MHITLHLVFTHTKPDIMTPPLIDNFPSILDHEFKNFLQVNLKFSLFVHFWINKIISAPQFNQDYHIFPLKLIFYSLWWWKDWHEIARNLKDNIISLLWFLHDLDHYIFKGFLWWFSVGICVKDIYFWLVQRWPSLNLSS